MFSLLFYLLTSIWSCSSIIFSTLTDVGVWVHFERKKVNFVNLNFVKNLLCVVVVVLLHRKPMKHFKCCLGYQNLFQACFWKKMGYRYVYSTIPTPHSAGVMEIRTHCFLSSNPKRPELCIIKYVYQLIPGNWWMDILYTWYGNILKTFLVTFNLFYKTISTWPMTPVRQLSRLYHPQSFFQLLS